MTRQVCVKLTEDEFREWTAVATEHGLTLPGLLRDCTNLVLIMDEKSRQR